MFLNYYQLCRKCVLFLFCILSFGGLISGMLLCLAKSPQAQAEEYMSLADTYMDQAYINNDRSEYFFKASEEMALMAISYAPYDDAMWKKLSVTRESYQALLESREVNKSLAFSSFH